MNLCFNFFVILVALYHLSNVADPTRNLGTDLSGSDANALSIPEWSCSRESDKWDITDWLSSHALRIRCTCTSGCKASPRYFWGSPSTRCRSSRPYAVPLRTRASPCTPPWISPPLPSVPLYALNSCDVVPSGLPSPVCASWRGVLRSLRLRFDIG